MGILGRFGFGFGFGYMLGYRLVVTGGADGCTGVLNGELTSTCLWVQVDVLELSGFGRDNGRSHFGHVFLNLNKKFLVILLVHLHISGSVSVI